MTDRRNLWVGLLLGGLLTGLLMFVLYQQATPYVVENHSGVNKSAGLPQESEVFVTKTDQPSPETNKKITDGSVKAGRPLTSDAQPKAELSDEQQIQFLEEIGLPKGLGLSPEEVEELSEAEQAEYRALLKSYHEVRDQVLTLHHERVQLKQRMDKMFEQNEVMEQELEKMREVIRNQPDQENVAK